MPDGIVMHENQKSKEEVNPFQVSNLPKTQINYINQTFFEMFLSNFGKSESSEKVINLSPEREHEYILNSYRIEDIFIKKTCYRIIDQKVETTIQQEEQPTQIIKSLQQFETGQVYEVMFRNFIGEFM